MNTYELVALFRTENNGYAAGLEKVKEVLSSHKVKVNSEEDMGERVLAYPVKKVERGHYHLLVVKSDPAKVLSVENEFKLQENLLRYLFVKKEKE